MRRAEAEAKRLYQAEGLVVAGREDVVMVDFAASLAHDRISAQLRRPD